MSATKPIPPPPLNSTNKDDWDRWYTLVSNITIPQTTGLSVVTFSGVRPVLVNNTAANSYGPSQTIAVPGILTTDTPVAFNVNTAASSGGLVIVNMTIPSDGSFKADFLNTTEALLPGGLYGVVGTLVVLR